MKTATLVVDIGLAGFRLAYYIQLDLPPALQCFVSHIIISRTYQFVFNFFLSSFSFSCILSYSQWYKQMTSWSSISRLSAIGSLLNSSLDDQQWFLLHSVKVPLACLYQATSLLFHASRLVRMRHKALCIYIQSLLYPTVCKAIQQQIAKSINLILTLTCA